MRIVNLLVVLVAVLISIPCSMNYFSPVKHTLAGKCAVITGASYGIGVTFAHELARQNISKIVVAARSLEKLEAVATKLRQDWPKLAVLAVAADVSDDSSRKNLLSKSHAFFGDSCTTILVNNAGIENWKPLAKMTPEDIDRTIDVNFRGMIHLTRLFLPDMLKLNAGHVVNTGSISGLLGGPFQNIYAATKSGLSGFTGSMRAEMLQLKSAVTFHAICPGFIVDAGMASAGFSSLPNYDQVIAASGTSTPQDSADALVEAIVYDVPEIIVNSVPLRIMVVLVDIFPRFLEWLPVPAFMEEFYTAIGNR